MARARILGSRGSRQLAGWWEVAATTPGLAAEPADLDRLAPRWITCSGPMTVAAALREAGQWDIDQSRDFDAEDWWYRCRFPLIQPAEPVRLRFGGLATVADAWLNGRHILHSDSMFIAHSVSIERWLSAENELILRFHALTPLLASRRPRPRWRTKLISHQALRWYRTALLGRMPAWCPAVAPVGPWRPIEIETGPLHIEQTDLRVELNRQAGTARIGLDVACPQAATVTGFARVGEHETDLTREPLPDGRSLLTGVVRVDKPDLWWPHTHGPQPLYPVRASISVNGSRTDVDLGRVGFRTIAVDREADGNGFGLVVNSIPVFCRGVCWTPLDLAALSAGDDGYRAALELFRDAGMNMVRVGGTMTYETDAFHDVCDELGILVWQDFMFANMDYPSQDEAFAQAVSLEAMQTLEALQSRASLAVLCGGSEIDQQSAMLGLPAEHRANSRFEDQLRSLVRRAAPSTVWLPGTPHGGTFPFQANSGVSHYYGVGAYQRSFDDARRASVRFAAECLAFSNVPEPAAIDRFLHHGEAPGSHPRWKSGVPRDSGVGWDFEDVRDHYLQRLFAVTACEVRARDPDQYLALGRVATGEAMLRTFAEWRRSDSTCRGGLVWFARDLQPGAGWGIVDFTGCPKAAYWYLRRVLQPVALLASDEGLNGLWLHAVNDTPSAIEADLRISLYRDGIKYGDSGLMMLGIPAHGQRAVHADALFEGFRDLTYAYRFGPSTHDVVSAALHDRGTGALLATTHFFPQTLPAEIDSDLGLAARAEPTHRGYELLLSTDRFAYAVAIQIPGWLPSDNYFCLEPGETRRLQLQNTMPAARPCGSVSALNSRGAVSVLVAEAVGAH